MEKTGVKPDGNFEEIEKKETLEVGDCQKEVLEEIGSLDKAAVDCPAKEVKLPIMKNVNFLSDVVIAPLNEKQDLTGNIEGSKKSQNFQEFKRRKSRKKSSMKDKFSPELLQLQKDRTIFNNDGYCMVKLDNKKSHGDYFENGKIRFAGENVQSKPCICTSDGYMLKWS